MFTNANIAPTDQTLLPTAKYSLTAPTPDNSASTSVLTESDPVNASNIILEKLLQLSKNPNPTSYNVVTALSELMRFNRHRQGVDIHRCNINARVPDAQVYISLEEAEVELNVPGDEIDDENLQNFSGIYTRHDKTPRYIRAYIRVAHLAILRRQIQEYYNQIP